MSTQNFMPSWQSVHTVAKKAVAIVVQNNPASAYANLITSFEFVEGAGAGGERSGAAATASRPPIIPLGKHGEIISGEYNHD